LRENTERPVTIEMGTNVLAGTTRSSILEAFQISRRKQAEGWKLPPLWDGLAAERIWEILLR
jgi:UDP-N-acetylglucosamine 2-epimerase (non-hydrolysing)